MIIVPIDPVSRLSKELKTVPVSGGMSSFTGVTRNDTRAVTNLVNEIDCESIAGNRSTASTGTGITPLRICLDFVKVGTSYHLRYISG